MFVIVNGQIQFQFQMNKLKKRIDVVLFTYVVHGTRTRTVQKDGRRRRIHWATRIRIVIIQIYVFKWAIPGLYFCLFNRVDSKQMLNINFVDDCIQTADPWYPKQPLSQLSHNNSNVCSRSNKMLLFLRFIRQICSRLNYEMFIPSCDKLTLNMYSMHIWGSLCMSRHM